MRNFSPRDAARATSLEPGTVTPKGEAMRFFVNTGDGIEHVDTQEEAIRIASGALDDYRDAADPEWPEEVENICWGVILGESVRNEVNDGEFVEFELSDCNELWRCNLCGGLVAFDGTPPQSESAK